MSEEERFHHERLPCGVEFAALPIAGRRTATFEIRILAGMANEPSDKLGIANLVAESIDKGTAKRSGQALNDAFDAIGAQRSLFAGREAFVFRCTCLPEFVGQALALHVELLRTPAFPEESCAVAIDLAKQELTALDDEPDEMLRKFLARHGYGEVLGRHTFGTRESLDRITGEDISAYWRSHFGAARMLVSAGGVVDVDRFSEALEARFEGFGNGTGDGRATFPLEFSPGRRHYDKKLEQEYIGICWPGVPKTHPDYSVEVVLLAVLSGGMSSRLFTEVREKQGLVYWVGAWNEHPRGAGMMFAGASSTPPNCDKTYRSLLREVDRLAEDISEEEMARAKVGIAAKRETHGDATSSRVGELGADLFHYGRPVPRQEKLDKVMAVTIDDVRRYLGEQPRDRLCVVTLGPRPLEDQAP
ncbi:MAG: pitrilysin family protein [Planctomycetota bacterium]|nr:pitrilysin family protein [Planctomycetota bacterium]